MCLVIIRAYDLKPFRNKSDVFDTFALSLPIQGMSIYYLRYSETPVTDSFLTLNSPMRPWDRCKPVPFSHICLRTNHTTWDRSCLNCISSTDGRPHPDSWPPTGTGLSWESPARPATSLTNTVQKANSYGMINSSRFGFLPTEHWKVSVWHFREQIVATSKYVVHDKIRNVWETRSTFASGYANCHLCLRIHWKATCEIVCLSVCPVDE